MRFAVLLLLSFASPALACDDRLLAVEDDWIIEAAHDSSGLAVSRLTLTYRNAGSQQFRQIDATVEFVDELGFPLASVTLDRHVGLTPGGSARMERTFAGDRLSRINRLDRATVTVRACVWSAP